MSRSILIIKPSSLGDIVHTLPAVAAIREKEPDAKITWVINPEWAPLLRGNPDVDHVHIFPRGDFQGLGAPANILSWWRKTRTICPDVAIDFQGLLRSALIAKISGAKEIYGLSDGREGSKFFYHHIARVQRGDHAVDRYLKLAELFGAPAREPIRFPLPTGDAPPRFDPYPPFVLLHPYARGSKKSLSASAIEQLCQALDPERVIVVGKSARQFHPSENCVDLTNQTSLLQLVWLIRKAAFVISVDSGPMHIAAASAQNLVSIHTWSDPRRVGPYRGEAWVWRNGTLTLADTLADTGKLPRGRRFKAGDIASIIELVTSSIRNQTKDRYSNEANAAK